MHVFNLKFQIKNLTFKYIYHHNNIYTSSCYFTDVIERTPFLYWFMSTACVTRAVPNSSKCFEGALDRLCWIKLVVRILVIVSVPQNKTQDRLRSSRKSLLSVAKCSRLNNSRASQPIHWMNNGGWVHAASECNHSGRLFWQTSCTGLEDRMQPGKS